MAAAKDASDRSFGGRAGQPGSGLNSALTAAAPVDDRRVGFEGDTATLRPPQADADGQQLRQQPEPRAPVDIDRRAGGSGQVVGGANADGDGGDTGRPLVSRRAAAASAAFPPPPPPSTIAQRDRIILEDLRRQVSSRCMELMAQGNHGGNIGWSDTPAYIPNVDVLSLAFFAFAYAAF